MKPAVFQTKPGRWHCVSDDNTISFDTWQEALAEANHVAWREPVTRALHQQLPHLPMRIARSHGSRINQKGHIR